MISETSRPPESFIENPQLLKLNRVQAHRFIKYTCSILSTFKKSKADALSRNLAYTYKFLSQLHGILADSSLRVMRESTSEGTSSLEASKLVASSLMRLNSRQRRILVFNCEELTFLIGYALLVLANIVAKMKNLSQQNNALAGLQTFVEVCATLEKPKLFVQQNSVQIAILKLKVLQGKPVSDCLTLFRSLHYSLLREVRVRYHKEHSVKNQEKAKKELQDSLLRLVVHFSNMMLFLAKIGKLKAAFTISNHIKLFYPVLEPSAVQFLRNRSEFLKSNFEHFYEEVLEFEQIIEEFKIYHSEERNEPTLSTSLEQSNVMFYREKIDKKHDLSVFGMHNSLVISKVRSLQKRFRESDPVMTCRADETPVSSFPSSTLKMKQSTLSKSKSTFRVNKNMDQSIFHISRNPAITSDPCTKSDHLGSLNIPKCNIDQFFLNKIDRKLDIQFAQAQISHSLANFKNDTATSSKVLTTCKSTLRMNKKENIKNNLDYFLFTQQAILHKEDFLKEIFVKHRQHNTHGATPIIETPIKQLQSTKPSLSGILIKKKLLKAANLEKMREAYLKSNRGNLLSSFDQTSALKMTKEAIKKNLEMLEKEKVTLNKQDRILKIRSIRSNSEGRALRSISSAKTVKTSNPSKMINESLLNHLMKDVAQVNGKLQAR